MSHSKEVKIGGRAVGVGHPVYIIAEIGINHNGDIETARQLIDAASESGCDAVKFQKRTVDVVYSAEELARPRENPFGATNGDLKRGLEFDETEYAEIDAYCREKNIHWFASCWDEGAVDVMERFEPVCYKIASASLTDDGLLRHHRETGRPIIASTGMCDGPRVDRAVEVLGKDDLVLLHTTSTYPTKSDELNLRAIVTLHERFGVPVGYSGHEVGLQTSVAAVALGACVVERHITLDRAMWGSDQSASVEPQGFARLVRDIRAVEEALGDGDLRIFDSEVPMMQKLRRIG
jgi:N-acetylneuraminate synthase